MEGFFILKNGKVELNHPKQDRQSTVQSTRGITCFCLFVCLFVCFFSMVLTWNENKNMIGHKI